MSSPSSSSSDCSAAIMVAPPEKPPRLYLPLSLSEWDLRARKQQKQQKLLIKNCWDERWRWSSRERSNRGGGGKNQIIIGDNGRPNGNWAPTKGEEECGVRRDEEGDCFRRVNGMRRPIVQKRRRRPMVTTINIASGEDRLSIASSTLSAPIMATRNGGIGTKLLNHSQSLAKMFSAFRLRSKSTAVVEKAAKRAAAGGNRKANGGEGGGGGGEGERGGGGELLPLGEHSSWLHSQGIFGRKEGNNNGLEEEVGEWEWRSPAAIRRRSKSAGQQAGDGQLNRKEGPMLPTILIVQNNVAENKHREEEERNDDEMWTRL